MMWGASQVWGVNFALSFGKIGLQFLKLWLLCGEEAVEPFDEASLQEAWDEM